MICSAPDCNNLVLVKSAGLCHMHYQRLRRTGTIDPKPRARRVCTVGGCENFVHGNGLCAKHWARKARHGDASIRLRQRDEGPAETRWMAKVSVESPGCWMWTAGTTGASGYGAYEGTTAHLYVYRLLVGPVPDGLELDHLCRRRLCCNPDHLEPVTRLINTTRGARGAGKGRPKS